VGVVTHPESRRQSFTPESGLRRELGGLEVVVVKRFRANGGDERRDSGSRLELGHRIPLARRSELGSERALCKLVHG